MGERLLLSSDDTGTDGHYREVGTANSISNQIKLTSDWGCDTGEYFDFVIRGHTMKTNYTKQKESMQQTVLWDDYLWMDEEQTVNVPILEQKHGVMLMFSAYSNGEPKDWHWSSHIILKKEVELLNGGGRTFLVGVEGDAAFKYLYIYSNKIVGKAINKTGTSVNYVLRKIIGF